MPVLHYLRMLLTYMCVITMTSARLGADLSLPITHLRLAALHCRLPPIPVECQPERLWLWWTHTHNLTSLIVFEQQQPPPLLLSSTHPTSLLSPNHCSSGVCTFICW